MPQHLWYQHALQGPFTSDVHGMISLYMLRFRCITWLIVMYSTVNEKGNDNAILQLWKIDKFICEGLAVKCWLSHWAMIWFTVSHLHIHPWKLIPDREEDVETISNIIVRCTNSELARYNSKEYLKSTLVDPQGHGCDRRPKGQWGRHNRQSHANGRHSL